MEKINLSNIGKVNLENKKINQNRRNENSLASEKEVDSSSLDIISNYNKASLNLSFKGANCSVKSADDMTNEELEEFIRKKLENKGIEDDEIDEYTTNATDVINYISENINLSKKNVIEIMDAGQFWNDLSLAVTSLTGMADRKYVGRAYVLAKLVNNDIVDIKTLKNITHAFTKSGAFCAAFNGNIANNLKINYFDEVLKKIGFNDNQKKIAKSIAEGIVDGDLSNEDLDLINWNDLSMKDNAISSMVQGGAPLVLVLKYRDKLDYEKFLKEVPSGYDIEINELQNDAGIELVATRDVSSSNNSSEMDCTDIIKNITMHPDGNITKSTIYSNGRKEEGHFFDGNRTVILEEKDVDLKKDDEIKKFSIPISQLEIVNNEDNEPSYILYSKESSDLPGAYETTKYNLSDYSEDIDIISEIKNGTLKGGEKLSSVTLEKGLTSYRQNYERNGNKIKRNYKKQVDPKGNLISVNYQYNITDKNGKELLSLDRSWLKNPVGTATTIINGNKYNASFDDNTKTVTIISEDGEKTTFSINNLFTQKSRDEYSAALLDKDNKEENKINENLEEDQENFWEMCKTLPADQLINLGTNIKDVTITNNIGECGISTVDSHLKIMPNAPILCHELGHALDIENGELGAISQNEELIEIYNKEMKQFKDEYPELAQNVISYFTQVGGGGILGGKNNTGLSELVAESNTLLSTYGNNNEVINNRAEYLVKYFPETMAKIAQLIYKT